jgi:hypothetical protein
LELIIISIGKGKLLMWKTGELKEYGIYWIEYYVGNTKLKEVKLLNYIDDLMNEDDEMMFEEFGTIESLIIKKSNIIRWIEVELPKN